MIPRHTIDQIMDHTSAEEVIGRFVTLKKRGANHIGLCPFHDEKTPSFAVSPSKGIYKCFGCGRSGNAVNFLMEHEHFSYPEALRYLAKMYNIEVEEENVPDTAQKDDRERIYAALNYAGTYFRDQLRDTDTGRDIAMTYLKERGFKPAVIESFSVGYSPEGWENFLNSARKMGFEIEILEKAGLITQSAKGNYVDRFRGRLMFPIRSMAGRVLGFGGRILGEKQKEAKYINSPETEVYDKSRVLFGLHNARKAIGDANECLVVEGYTDVLALHQQGFENVVSVSGTSLTEDHVRQLHRLTSNLTFIFDADEAGTKAGYRAINLALEQNLHVQLISLPEGEDPGSFAIEKSTEEIENYFKEKKKDFLSFMAEGIRECPPNEQADKISVIAGAVACIPDPVRRELHIKSLSKMLDLEQKTLNEEINRHILLRARQKHRKIRSERGEEQDVNTENQVGEVEKKPEGLQKLNAESNVERHLISLLLLYGERPFDEDRTVASYITEQLQKVTITVEMHKRILQEYLDHLEKGTVPGIKTFINHSEREIQKLAADQAASGEQPLSPNWMNKFGIIVPGFDSNYVEEVKHTLNHLMIRKIDELIRENQEKLKSPESELAEHEHLEVHKYLLEMRGGYAEDLGATIF